MRASAEEKLVAILIADVADYDRLLAHDRRRAEIALQLQYHEVIDAAIAIYGGRIFDLEPACTLAEFADPLAAVRCAVEIQERLSRSAAAAPAERIRLRIGLHYGDALVDRGEISGEVMTIAWKVHALAAPGEICASRTVVDAVGRRVEHGFEDLADLARPVPKAGLAFRLEAAPGTLEARAPAWLGSAGRLALTALILVAAIWLAMTGGRPS